MRSGFGGRVVGVGLWSRFGGGGPAETATTGSTPPDPIDSVTVFGRIGRLRGCSPTGLRPGVEAPAAAFETDGTSFWQSSAVL